MIITLCLNCGNGRLVILEENSVLIEIDFITGKRAFIAGVADDNGYGWAIAKSLAAAGAEILVGTWVPVSRMHLLSFIG